MEALKDLERQVKAGEIETVIVAFTDHIGRYMGKRYDAGTTKTSKY
jgi:glutamine synthetase